MSEKSLVESANKYIDAKKNIRASSPYWEIDMLHLAQAVVDSYEAQSNLKRVMSDKDLVRIEAFGMVGELEFHSATEKVDKWLSKYSEVKRD